MRTPFVSQEEEKLIREYRSKSDSRDRCVVIQDYARLMHISEGRAEDDLGLWMHLLATAGRLRKAGLLAAMLTVAVVAYGQTSRGTVTGTVQDQTGAVIVAARVTLTGVDTGVRLSTVSNDSGIYRFDAVDLGVYELQVTHPGFRTYVATGISVEANRATTLDPRLEVGAAETRVEVNEESSDVLTKESPLRGANFRSRQVRDLPLNSLNPLSLARTLPGATEASGSRVWGAGTFGVSNGGGFSINGQRPRGNNYLLGWNRKQRGLKNRCSLSPMQSKRCRFRPATSGWSLGAPAAAYSTW